MKLVGIYWDYYFTRRSRLIKKACKARVY